MYHLLWERWAAEQTENVCCKRKSNVRSGAGAVEEQWVQEAILWYCNWYSTFQKHFVIVICIRMNCETAVTGVGCNPCSSPGTSGYCNIWVVAGLATLAAPTKILDCGQYWRKSAFLELADLRPLIKCIHSFPAELQSYHDVIIGQLWSSGLRNQKLENMNCLDLPQSVLWDPGLVT